MKKIMAGILCLLTLATLAGCARVQTGDPVADGALKAFNGMVSQHKDRKGFHATMQHWGITLSGADKFEWSKDTSANGIDFAMVMAAEPFLAAGLDVTRLSDYVFKAATVEEGKAVPDLLIHPYNVSDKKETAQGSDDAMRRLLKQDPTLVTYNPDAFAYSLNLSQGYSVQWMETPKAGAADLVFRIAADPLIAAGVDASQLAVSGWLYQPAGMDTNLGDHPNQFIKQYALSDAQ